MNFIKGFLPYGTWSALDYFMVAIFGLVGLFVAFLLFVALAWICKMIFYKTYYAEMKTYKGEVLDMEYTPPRTWTTSSTVNGVTTTQVHTDPEKNVVIIRTELRETSIDSDKLYQRVRVGESVIVKSQAKHIEPRFWQGAMEYDGEMLVSVTSEKNQTVLFNDEEPVTYKKRGW